MYFWRIKPLKEEIINQKLTDKKLFPYFFFYLVLTELLWLASSYSDCIELALWDHLGNGLYIVIIMGGMIYTYTKNGGGEGKDFILKFFSLGFVLGVRFSLYLIPIAVLNIFVDILIYGNYDETSTSPAQVILFSLWQGLYYYRLGKNIKDTVVVE